MSGEKIPNKVTLESFIGGWRTKVGKGCALAGVFIGAASYFLFDIDADLLFNIYQQMNDQPAVVETVDSELLPTFESQETPEHYEPVGELGDGTHIPSVWNIENVGKSKSEKPDAMDIIAKTVCEFPMMGIQEIQWKGNEKKLLDMIVELVDDTCQEPRVYIVSDRPADCETNCKDENYAIVFDPRVYNLLAEYEYPDANDDFVRQPFGGHFEVKDGNFDFILLLYHIKPDVSKTSENDTYEELLHLNDVYKAVQVAFPGEGDIIFGGDMNVG